MAPWFFLINKKMPWSTSLRVAKITVVSIEDLEMQIDGEKINLASMEASVIPQKLTVISG